ncbi:hypothetical protein LI90_2516 [Carbonactinospora thermoautotrophica]|uniref:Transposase IS701-like DDE domain-containing protein n=1 Tax=Carbonactinospora thermoautotrophica TaxID=1469144 RepID=A0A132MUK9_9ACTN|nr:hypothetical protein LI90_2516 [Carbonactinospora thermoautotrophica]
MIMCVAEAPMIDTKAVRMSLQDDAARVESRTVLSRFRAGFYACLTARADALFALTGALLCSDGPVRTLAGLALAPEHRRGHGALYGGVNHGRIDAERLRDLLAAPPLPKTGDGRIVLAVDVSPWPRPDAAISPGRLFCHTWGRGRSRHEMIPGWPYPVVAALETGRTCWTAVLDAVRLGPDDDVAAVTANQVRGVVQRLAAAGQHRERRSGHPDRGRRRLPHTPAGLSAGRPAGGGTRPAALRPGAAPARTTPPLRPEGGTAAQARRGVPLHRPAPPGTSRTPPPHPPPATAP